MQDRLSFKHQRLDFYANFAKEVQGRVIRNPHPSHSSSSKRDIVPLRVYNICFIKYTPIPVSTLFVPVTPFSKGLSLIENNIRRSHNKVVLNTSVPYGNVEEEKTERGLKTHQQSC
jgi:hypothetical protein